LRPHQVQPGGEGAHELHVGHALEEGAKQGLYLLALHLLHAKVVLVEEDVLVVLHLVVAANGHELLPGPPHDVDLRELHLLEEERELDLVLLDLLGANKGP